MRFSDVRTPQPGEGFATCGQKRAKERKENSLFADVLYGQPLTQGLYKGLKPELTSLRGELSNQSATVNHVCA